MKPVMRETLADSLGEHALPHMEEVRVWFQSGVAWVN